MINGIYILAATSALLNKQNHKKPLSGLFFL